MQDRSKLSYLHLVDKTYLVAINADIIPVIHVSIDVQVVESIRDQERICLALELRAWYKDAVIGIAQVLLFLSAPI